MGLTGVTQVAAGTGFSLALRSDGTVWAWGGNWIGQLGHGTTSDHELAPVQVTGLTGVTKISAGAGFSLALRSNGTVWAWGDNRYGELGNGTTVSSSVPVKVAGLSYATGIAAGYDAAVATQTNGISAISSVWTWGGNSSGQLGDGTLTGHSTPERVAGINNVYFAGVTAGLWTAAVLGTDGSVWSWGNDTAGQLGNAPASSPVTRPVNTIAAGSRITQLSAGWGHMLALRSDGTVLAWGSNTGGQLGIGSTVPVAGPVQVTGLTAVSQVSAGGRAFSLAVHTVPWLVGQSS
jgi:alpha-tubulin suppressor-like RCC1 family protein